MTAPAVMYAPLARSPRRPARIAGLRLVRESTFVPPDEYDLREPVRSAKAVAEFMTPHVAREMAESLWVLALDAQNCVLGGGPICITRGILNSSLAHPREVFRAAILANAAAVILVHNHPSGVVTPSADDKVITERMVAAGRLLDLPVHDHVIMRGDGKYFSFAEQGILC